jgi:hypothetical protein
MFHKMKRMRTKLFIIAVAVLCTVTVAGQPKQWSLTDCIRYALEQNIQVRKADVSVSLGEITLQQAKEPCSHPLMLPLGRTSDGSGKQTA